MNTQKTEKTGAPIEPVREALRIIADVRSTSRTFIHDQADLLERAANLILTGSQAPIPRDTSSHDGLIPEMPLPKTFPSEEAAETARRRHLETARLSPDIQNALRCLHKVQAIDRNGAGSVFTRKRAIDQDEHQVGYACANTVPSLPAGSKPKDLDEIRQAIEIIETVRISDTEFLCAVEAPDPVDGAASRLIFTRSVDPGLEEAGLEIRAEFIEKQVVEVFARQILTDALGVVHELASIATRRLIPKGSCLTRVHLHRGHDRAGIEFSGDLVAGSIEVQVSAILDQEGGGDVS